MNWGDLTDIRRAVPQRFNVGGDAIGLAPLMGKAFEHAHDDTTEIDTNTIDASRLGLTASNMQNVLVGLARQIDAGQVAEASVSTPALGMSVAQIAKTQKERSERASRDAQFYAMLDQANTYAARLASEVEGLEAGLEARFGDAWREDLANEILDPDDIPQRRDGESMEEYRERLEETLVDEMVDPATGKVKPEYGDSDYKEWAERRYRQKEVDEKMEIAKDESRPQHERDAAVQDVIDTRDNDQIIRAGTHFDQNDEEYARLGDAVGTSIEDTVRGTSPDAVGQFLAGPGT